MEDYLFGLMLFLAIALGWCVGRFTATMDEWEKIKAENAKFDKRRAEFWAKFSGELEKLPKKEAD